MKLLNIVFFIFISSSLYSMNLEEEKLLCKSFGYTEGSESFGNCVLELHQQNKIKNEENLRLQQNNQQILNQQKTQQALENKRKGDEAYDILMDTIACLGNSMLCSTAYDKGCYYDLKSKGYTDKLAYKKCKLN